jgi:predicted nucleic acid-binding protein
MSRIVLDTNVIVSALLQPVGPPAQIFVLALGGPLQLYVSANLYAERRGHQPPAVQTI